MAGSVVAARAVAPPRAKAVRHSAAVRATHWLTALAFAALVVTGANFVISHPRFYWGEDGNVLMQPIFSLPIPSSRGIVKTGYPYVLRDQNGWSRYLHFQAAWLLVFTGAFYVIHGLVSKHFRRELMPARSDLTRAAMWRALRDHDSKSYNPVQRLTYLTVVFVLFPLMIWTGLAMSPAVTAAVPLFADAFGGLQSARTIHFVVTVLLVLFVIAHLAMVAISGFGERVWAMISGGRR